MGEIIVYDKSMIEKPETKRKYGNQTKLLQRIFI